MAIKNIDYTNENNAFYQIRAATRVAFEESETSYVPSAIVEKFSVLKII